MSFDISRSRTCYLFTCDKFAISWCSTKQILAATTLNHVEIVAIRELSYECV